MILPLDSLADLGAHGGIHSRAMHGSRSACRILTRAVKDHRFWRFASGLVCSAMQYVAVFSRASSVDQPQTHDQGVQCGLPAQRRPRIVLWRWNTLGASAIVTIRQNVIASRRTTHWPVFQLGTGWYGHVLGQSACWDTTATEQRTAR